MAQGEETIYLSLRGDKTKISNQLQSLPAIKYFSCLKEENDNQRYQIKTHQGEAICEELFHLAVNNHWVLTELRRDSLSLEDIFLQLTRGEKESV